MPDIRSVKTQITKLLKKNGVKPSVPSKGRIKPSHGLRLMDAGFQYGAAPFDDNAFYLGYYAGAFSMKLSDEQVERLVQKMHRLLEASSIPGTFVRRNERILVTIQREE